MRIRLNLPEPQSPLTPTVIRRRCAWLRRTAKESTRCSKPSKSTSDSLSAAPVWNRLTVTDSQALRERQLKGTCFQEVWWTLHQVLLSALPQPRKPRARAAPVLGPHHETTRELLVADLSAPRKRHYTPRLIWRRVVDERRARMADPRRCAPASPGCGANWSPAGSQ